MENDKGKNVKLDLSGGKSVEFKLLDGSVGPSVIDVSSLYKILECLHMIRDLCLLRHVNQKLPILTVIMVY